ncbi:hypothetical protein [Lysinibacillus sphaericus]|nr:hypothetical protein [Lysinibacillus sphaericus]
MEKFIDFSPRHKYDNDRVEIIKKMDRDQILPLLPNLLEFDSRYELASST